MANLNFVPDFQGWATRNDLVCGDGRTIKRDAFKHQDGHKVPLVWQHQRNDPENVLGYAILTNTPEGVRTAAKFNDTKKAQVAKMLVEHGDIDALSIFANHLQQAGLDVLHGDIKEVSLVISPSNPGATIDSPIAHGEGEDVVACIYTGLPLELEHTDDLEGSQEDVTAPQEETEPQQEGAEAPSEDGSMSHSDDESDETIGDVLKTFTEDQRRAFDFCVAQVAVQNGAVDLPSEPDDTKVEHGDDGPTIQDVINTMNEKQKKVLYYYVAIANALNKNMAVEHGEENEEDESMKVNTFDKNGKVATATLSHSDIEGIFKEGKRLGSLREAVKNFETDVLEHADNLTDLGYDPEAEGNYGIGNIDYLFPDAKAINNEPELIKREDAWVADFMANVHRSPFSRIKSLFANITAAEARAKGYTKGNKKIEEVFGLLKRTTTPTTIYKKQKLDRDDLIDIVDFNVVAFMKSEMRMMLDEEIARAALFSDGRSAASDDKINEQNIRPVWLDDDFFTVKATVETPVGGDADARAKAIIRTIIKSRKNYKGAGNCTMYTTEDALTDMLLLEDANGRVIYDTEDKLRTALRVKKIVTVPVMEDLAPRVDSDGGKHNLIALILNPHDYNIGADKGGAVSMFEDFDLDYNQEKYLIETRCSGALTKYHSAIAVEEDVED